MKKKLLFLSRSLGVAGVPISLINFVKSLNPMECDVTVGIFADDTELEWMLPEWVKIINFERDFKDKCKSFFSFYSYVSSHKKSLFFLWKFLNQLLKFKKKKQIKKIFVDLYDSANAFHQGIISEYVIKCIKAKRKILWYHSSIIMPDCKEKVFRKADLIVVVNPLVKNILLENWRSISEDSILCVPCLLDYKRILKLCKEDIDVKFDRKRINLITVCRLSYEKGMNKLIDMASFLKKENFDFSLYIIGSGNMENYLYEELMKHDLNEYVYVLGEQTNPYPYMKASDIFISSSDVECFGITIAEALIVNTIPICTKTCASLYHIKDGQTGFIVGHSGVLLAQKVLEVSKNPSIQKSIKNNINKIDYDNYFGKIKQDFIDLELH